MTPIYFDDELLPDYKARFWKSACFVWIQRRRWLCAERVRIATYFYGITMIQRHSRQGFAEVWIQNFYIIDWMQLCNINVLTSSLREDDQLFCTCDLEGFCVSLSETKGLTKAVWEILTFSRVSHWRKFLNLRADPSH